MAAAGVGWAFVVFILLATLALAPVALLVLSTLGVAVCVVASRRAEAPRIKEVAHVGQITGVCLVGFTLLGMLYFQGRETSRRASCANNLKAFWFVCREFARDNSGMLPALSSQPGKLFFATERTDEADITLHPEYLDYSNMLLCPNNYDESLGWEHYSDPAVILDDHSYFYLGYVVTNEKEMRSFAKTYKESISKGLKFDDDLHVADGSRISRLRRETGRSIGEESSRSQESLEERVIPVVIERPTNHVTMRDFILGIWDARAGGNVLYLDGHVEWLDYPGKWPMTTTTVDTLLELDGMTSDFSEKSDA
jgi:prepilin-type processing-associated H-X9-DG protein